ncbi:hypothetical protein LOY21_04540, partial [Staphylococcus capitis]|nr:hypothetical protein [Staphylococcus capitis]
YILSCYTISGYLASKYLIEYLNFKYLSEISLLAFLVLFFTGQIKLIIISMVFLGISSGLTRPQTIKGISNTSYLKQVLNNAENLYFIINTSFLY